MNKAASTRQNSKLRQIRAALANIPFDSLLGIDIARTHSDGVTLRCKVKRELLNKSGALHGGVTATLADAAVGFAIHYRFGGKRRISTVELKVNYFRPVVDGVVFARARLLRVGSTLCVGRVDLTDDRGNAVGTAIATYIFLDARAAGSESVIAHEDRKRS